MPSGTPSLNQRRLDELQKDPSTRYSDQGVIPIDNTLIDRDGMLIPDAGWFWDHAEERNKIAQDYLFANYVCTSGKHYPLEFRLFRKQEICEALKEPFRNHTVLCCELIDWVCERKIPGDFAMDSYFTNAEILNHIHGKKDRLGRPRGYVGDLKSNRKSGVEGADHQGQRPGGLDPAERSQGDADRRQTAVVLHGDGADPRRETQGSDRDSLAVSERRRRTLQDPGDQSDHLGGESDRAGLPASLDRYGDLSSGRQATTRPGRLSAA